MQIFGGQKSWKCFESHYWAMLHRKTLCFLLFVTVNVRPFFFDHKMLFWTETIFWKLFRIIQHIEIKSKSFLEKKKKIKKISTFLDRPQKSAFDKLSDVFFMKTFTSSGAIVVNLYPNLMKKIFCHFWNINIYKDNWLIALRQVLLFAKPFFVKIRHVSGTLK